MTKNPFFYKITLMMPLLVVCFALCSCSKKEEPVEYGDISIPESVSVADSEETPVVEDQREIRTYEELPEKESGAFDVMDGYRLLKIASERISINYPNDFDVVTSDPYESVFYSDDGTIIRLHRFYNNNFTDAQEVWRYAGQNLKSVSVDHDGKRLKLSVYSSNNKEESSSERGFQIVTEQPKITFSDDSVAIYHPNTGVSYSVISNEAYYVLAFSDVRDSKELAEISKKMIASIQGYIPSYYAGDVTLSKQVICGDGVTMNVPEDWYQYEDGRFLYLKPTDPESVYSGTELFILKDGYASYSSDALNLPPAVSSPCIKHIYDANNYDLTTDILDYQGIVIDGHRGHFFDIKDTIIPRDQPSVRALPVSGDKHYSYRYSFTDINGHPVVIGINYDYINKDQVYILIDQLISSIEFSN